MPIIAFRGMGVNAGAFGFGTSSTNLQIAVFTKAATKGAGPEFTSCGEVFDNDDSSTGKIKNKFILYGYAMCNTAPRGHWLGADANGKSMPLFLNNTYIELNANCGTIRSTDSVGCAVKLTVKERRPDGNAGAILYSFDGRMPISADFLSSDFAISGAFRNIDDNVQRATVAGQIYWDNDR